MSTLPPQAGGTFRALFNDVVAAMLKSAGTPGVPLTYHLARGLLFYFQPPIRMMVWELTLHLRDDPASPGGRGVTEAEVAGVASDGSARLVEMEVEDVLSRWRTRGPVIDAGGRPTLHPNPETPDAVLLSTSHTVELGVSGPRVTVLRQLWVVVELSQADASPEAVAELREKLRSMSAYYAGQTQLLSTLRALRAVGQQAELGRRVAALTSHGVAGRLEQLQATQDLLTEMLLERAGAGLSPGYLDLAERLGVWTLQQLLTAAPGLRNLGGKEARTMVGAVARQLAALATSSDLVGGLPTRPQREHSARQFRLECLASAIASLAEPQGLPLVLPPGPAADTDTLAWALLAQWTRLHERLRALGDKRWSREFEREWRSAAEDARVQLGRVLTERRGRSGSTETLGAFRSEGIHARNWLRLWFGHQLLRIVRVPPPGTAERKLVTAVAHVLREGIRFLLFGRLKEFRFLPSAMADSMRTLVQFHATEVVRLPWNLGLADVLHRIGAADDAEDRAFAAGHLQHVLELYVAGHFLGQIQIEAPGMPIHGWTLRELMARRGESELPPSPEAVQVFIQAFSLAVLTHDVAMDLLPRGGPRTDLAHRHKILDEWLRAGPRTAVRDIGRRLIERAQADLTELGYADLSETSTFDPWIKEQLELGRPDHGLLGAWLLHHLCEGVPGLGAEIVKDAVRAVLLHSVPSQVISADDDPVAALLVLCDELFEWLPSTHRSPSTHSPAHAAVVSDVEATTTLSRARRVIIRHLQVALGPKGIVATMTVPRTDPESERPTDPGSTDRRSASELFAERAWPHFELVLHHPEMLEVPVHITWLTVTQNLRRITPSRSGWRFALTITSRVRAEFIELDLNTRDVLDRAAQDVQLDHSVRSALTDWLGAVQHRCPPNRAVSESVTLVADGRPLHGPDLRHYRDSMSESVERVLADVEKTRRDSP